MKNNILILIIFTLLQTFTLLLSAEEGLKYNNIKINYLTNSDLLEKTQVIYNKSSIPFLAELRAVHNNEKQFENLQIKIKTLTASIAKLKEPSETKNSDVQPQLLLEYTKKRQKLLKEKEILLLNEKSLITQQIDQINSTKLSADVFIQSFDQLGIYLLEIQQRIDDGSLEKDKVPLLLQTENIKEKQKFAYKQRLLLKDKLTKNNEYLDTYSKNLTLFQEKLEKSHAQYSAMKKNYDKLISEKEIEKSYSDKTIAELKQEYIDLYNEHHWLTRRSEQAFKYLKENKKSVDKQEIILKKHKLEKEKELKSAGISNITMLQNLDTNNIQDAEKISKQVIDFYDEKLKILGSIQSKLDILIKAGHSLKNEIEIFQKQLLKSKILTIMLKNLAEQKKIDTEWIKENNHDKEFNELNQILSERMIEVLSLTKSSEDKKSVTNMEVKHSKQAKEEIREKVENIRKMFSSTEKISQWVATLEKMDTEKLLNHFKKIRLQLSENQKQLKQQATVFENIEKEKEISEKSLTAIRDPLWQLAKKESLNYERDILKKLYQFSGEKLPEKYIQEDISIEKSNNTKIASKQDQDDKDKDKTNSIKNDSTEEVRENNSQSEYHTKSSEILDQEKEYRDNVSSWLRVIDNQNEAKLKFLQSLEKLQQSIIVYSEIILETRTTIKKYQADAIELKKRFIKYPKKMEKISSYELTENINNALNIELLKDLEVKASYLLSQRSFITKKIKELKTPDETLSNISIALKEIEHLETKIIEIQLELDKLESDFSKERKQLSTLELQNLEQMAWDRLHAENTIKEVLVDITPSKQAENLMSLLHGYYIELIEISEKEKNIEVQIESVNTIIASIQNEKPFLEKIIPLLLEYKSKIEKRQDEINAMIKIALVPTKSELISQQYFDKTGEKLSIPLTLDDDKKEQEIEKNAKYLSELHTSLSALDKWITLFQNRLKNTGIDANIGQYQNMLGKLSSQNIKLKHHIRRISGNSLESLQKLPLNEKPKSTKEQQLFLKGKVGALRDDRYKINKDAIIKLMLRLLSIILIAFLLLKLTDWIFKHLKERVKDDTDPQSSFVQAFFKAFIKIVIWSIAILSLLSSVGFQIGAILAGLGIGGFAIAIAAKETLSNILAGVTLFLEKPFKIGDTIKVDGQSPQRVVNMTWRSTQMVDSNSYYINIPNSVVADAALTNYTKNDSSRDYVYIGLSPRYDSETVISIMLQAVDECGEILLQDKIKDVKLMGVKIYSETPFISYRIRFYIANYHSRGGVRDQVLRKVKQKLAENDISIASELRLPK